jgi:hypothetical protein
VYQTALETPQALVCLPAKTRNVICCPHCGTDFEQANRRQRFCGGACRVAAHRRVRRERTLQFRSELRAAFGMCFDGRLGGTMRNVGRNRPSGYAARHAAVGGAL